jgi:di/tripeptidase
VGAADPFESDFMAQYLAKKKLSKEAKAVLNAGKVLWSAYFAKKDKLKTSVKADYKLNRLDVGWYQIRNALKSFEGSNNEISFVDFNAAYKTLTEKLQPQVYEFGFLRDSEKLTEIENAMQE